MVLEFSGIVKFCFVVVDYVVNLVDIWSFYVGGVKVFVFVVLFYVENVFCDVFFDYKLWVVVFFGFFKVEVFVLVDCVIY